MKKRQKMNDNWEWSYLLLLIIKNKYMVKLTDVCPFEMAYS